MNLEHYKLFAQLFESFIKEDSSAIGMIGNLPSGKAVAQKLHKDMGLAHDQQFTSVDKISWSELKNMYSGAWVLIKGSKGAGAIRTRHGSYEAAAADPESGEVVIFQNDRGGNILDFLKERIGKLQAFYVGEKSRDVERKKEKRSLYKATPGPQQVTRDTLVRKFKPVWLKSMQAAEADIKGMIATMIKNGAYNKAEKKLNILQRLQRSIDQLEVGDIESAPEWMVRAVTNAIVMAASHHYPEQTGDLSLDRRSRSGELVAQNGRGTVQLMSDISKGDTKKLGTVLGFFKRNLITG